jgi:hypothetical protein
MLESSLGFYGKLLTTLESVNSIYFCCSELDSDSSVEVCRDYG